jgi:uncharacterized protein (TIGR00369 family)
MIANHSGNLDFEIVEYTESVAVGRMTVTSGALNPFGTIHAGAVVWFADVVATTLALNGAEVRPGEPGFPLALNFDVTFLGNRSDGVLSATAKDVKRDRAVPTVRTIVTGPDNKPLLELTSTHLYSR